MRRADGHRWLVDADHCCATVTDGIGMRYLAALVARPGAPPTVALWAPLWVLERGVCVWLAVGGRLVQGGTGYHGRTIQVAAHSPRALRARGLR